MIHFELITPEKISLSDTVYEAILPTVNGQIAVLPHHIPLVTLLQPGVIAIRRQKGDSDEQLEYIATSGGFVEVTGNSVKVMADTAERADELDELRIQEAREAAKRRMTEAKDEVSYANAVAALEVELARQKVKNIRRRHRGG